MVRAYLKHSHTLKIRRPSVLTPGKYPASLSQLRILRSNYEYGTASRCQAARLYAALQLIVIAANGGVRAGRGDACLAVSRCLCLLAWQHDFAAAAAAAHDDATHTRQQQQCRGRRVFPHTL